MSNCFFLRNFVAGPRVFECSNRIVRALAATAVPDAARSREWLNQW
jgi:hypothetical protein